LRQLRHFVFAFALAALPAAALADSGSSPVGQPPLPEMHAQNPWFRYLQPNQPAAGYMVLQNTGTGTAILTGASSPDCRSLVVGQGQNGTSAVADITVPAHGSVVFAVGGYDLTCKRPKLAVGGRIPFALHFKDGAVLLLMAPVYGATKAPPHA
jgi:copper(I)-binding protein